MYCPTCGSLLDDTLDFAQEEPLHCPACGRLFTEQEVLLMPLGDPAALFAPFLTQMAPRTTVITTDAVYL
jgi:hypothetical protein